MPNKSKDTEPTPPSSPTKTLPKDEGVTGGTPAQKVAIDQINQQGKRDIDPATGVAAKEEPASGMPIDPATGKPFPNPNDRRAAKEDVLDADAVRQAEGASASGEVSPSGVPMQGSDVSQEGSEARKAQNERDRNPSTARVGGVDPTTHKSAIAPGTGTYQPGDEPPQRTNLADSKTNPVTGPADGKVGIAGTVAPSPGGAPPRDASLPRPDTMGNPKNVLTADDLSPPPPKKIGPDQPPTQGQGLPKDEGVTGGTPAAHIARTNG